MELDDDWELLPASPSSSAASSGGSEGGMALTEAASAIRSDHFTLVADPGASAAAAAGNPSNSDSASLLELGESRDYGGSSCFGYVEPFAVRDSAGGLGFSAVNTGESFGKGGTGEGERDKQLELAKASEMLDVDASVGREVSAVSFSAPSGVKMEVNSELEAIGQSCVAVMEVEKQASAISVLPEPEELLIGNINAAEVAGVDPNDVDESEPVLEKHVALEKNGGHGDKGGGVLWWRIPLELLKNWAFRVRPIWSIPVAAAILGLVLLGRRMYKIRRKSRGVPLKIAVDEKGASQFAAQANRLNAALSMVRRVPVFGTSSAHGGFVPAHFMLAR